MDKVALTFYGGEFMRIEEISSLSSLGRVDRVEKIRPYTEKEMAEKLKAAEKFIEEDKELSEYFSKYKNPNNLSFQELLKQELGITSRIDDTESVKDIVSLSSETGKKSFSEKTPPEKKDGIIDFKA